MVASNRLDRGICFKRVACAAIRRCFQGDTAMIPQRLRTLSHGVHAAVAFLALALAWTDRAKAEITRLVIARIESPTFEGLSFGAVGPYEKLRLRAFGEVD